MKHKRFLAIMVAFTMISQSLTTVSATEAIEATEVIEDTFESDVILDENEEGQEEVIEDEKEILEEEILEETSDEEQYEIVDDEDSEITTLFGESEGERILNAYIDHNYAYAMFMVEKYNNISTYNIYYSKEGTFEDGDCEITEHISGNSFSANQNKDMNGEFYSGNYVLFSEGALGMDESFNERRGYFYVVPVDENGDEIENVRSEVVNNVNTPVAFINYVNDANTGYKRSNIVDTVIVRYTPDGEKPFEVVDSKEGVEIHEGEALRLGSALVYDDGTVHPLSDINWMNSLWNYDFGGGGEAFKWFAEDISDGYNYSWPQNNSSNVEIADSSDRSININAWIRGLEETSDDNPAYVSFYATWYDMEHYTYGATNRNYNMYDNIDKHAHNYREIIYRIPVKVLAAEPGVEYEDVPQVHILNTAQEALQYARDLIRDRKADTAHTFYTPKNIDMSQFNATRLMDFDAEREDMKPWEGDYMRYTYLDAGIISQGNFTIDGVEYKSWAVFAQDTHTITKEMEEEFSEKIDFLVNDPSGALYEANQSNSDEEKIKAIFDYITKNVSGEVKPANTPEYRTLAINHTAYTALMKGYGTCQAFAVLFTRLSREMGVPSKVIMGTDANAHTYNVVKNGPYWYFTDCSAGIYLRDYNSFARTTEQDWYRSSNFQKNYFYKIKGYGINAPKNVEILKDGETFDYSSTLEDARELVCEYIKQDNAELEDGEELPVYTVRLLANLKASADSLYFSDTDGMFNPGTVFYYGTNQDCSSQVVVDLNGKTLTVPGSTAIRAQDVKNGTISITGKQADLLLYGPSKDYSKIENYAGLPDDYLSLPNMGKFPIRLSNVKFVGSSNYESILLLNDVSIDATCKFSGINELMVGYPDYYLSGEVVCDTPVSIDEIVVTESKAQFNKTVTAKSLDISSDCILNDATVSGTVSLLNSQNESAFAPSLSVNGTISAGNYKLENYATLHANNIKGTSVNSKFNMNYKSRLFVDNQATLYNLSILDWPEWDGSFDYNGIYKKENATVYIENTVNKIANPGDVVFRLGIFDVNDDGEFVLKDIDKQTELVRFNVKKTFDITPMDIALPSGSETKYNCVYKENGAVYVNAKNIILKQISAGEETVLGEYAIWEDAATHIETMTNPRLTYAVDFAEGVSEITLNTALTQPTKAAKLLVRASVLDDPVKLNYIGDLKLNTELEFDNVEISSSKFNASGERVETPAQVQLNGHGLTLYNSDMLNVSAVTSAGTAANNNINLIESSIVASGNVDVKGTTTLKGGIIDANGTVTLNNIVSATPDGFEEPILATKNIVKYGNASKTILNLNGSVSTDYNDTVYACKNDGEEFFTFKTGIDETTDYDTVVLVKRSAIGLEYKQKNNVYTVNEIIANVTKSVASNFVVVAFDPEIENYGLKGIVNKSANGKNIVYGGDGSEQVILWTSTDGERYNYEAGYATLNDAFAEIDRLAVDTNYYKITVPKETEENPLKPATLLLPSKAALVTVEGASEGGSKLHYTNGKTGIALKCNVTFKNLELMPTDATKIVLGNYELTLEDCEKNPDSPAFASITGGSATGKSGFTLSSSEGEVELLVTGNIDKVGLVCLENAKLISNGTINIGEIAHRTDDTSATLIGTATVTRSKVKASADEAAVIQATKIVPNITFSGEWYSVSQPVKIGLQEKITLPNKTVRYEMIPFDGGYRDAYGGTTISTDMNYFNEMVGYIPLVKAPKMEAKNIELCEENKGESEYYFVKNSQYVNCIKGSEDEAEVTLCYTKSNDYPLEQKFRTYQDAINEINFLKQNREYIIKINNNICENKMGTTTAPLALAMPAANCAYSLVIQSADSSLKDVYFTGDINITVPTTFKDVNLIRCDKATDKIYYPAQDIYADYPTAMLNLKLNNMPLGIDGKVFLNVPVKISGTNKSSMTIADGAVFYTQTNDLPYETDSLTSTVVGTITGLGKLDVPVGGLDVYEAITTGYDPATDRTSKKVTATPANITVTELVTDGEVSISGVALSRGKAPGYEIIQGKPNSIFKVTKLVTYDGEEICTEGTVNIANLEMHGKGAEKAAISICATNDFNITGTISMVDGQTNATFITNKTGVDILDDPNPKKLVSYAPYLNVSGKLDNSVATPITVSVREQSGEYANVRIPAGNTKLKNVGKLLTTKNGNVSQFVADKNNVDNKLPFSDENKDGYTLLKSGSDIFVYYTEDIKVAVYEEENATGDLYSATKDSNLIGYFLTFEDAVKAVDAQKRKTSDYLIYLYHDCTVTKAVFPTYARSIKLAGEIDFADSDEEENLYSEILFNTSITAKVPLQVDGIYVESIIDKNYRYNGTFTGTDVSLLNSGKIKAGTVTVNNVEHDETDTYIMYEVTNSGKSSGKGNLTISGDITFVPDSGYDGEYKPLNIFLKTLSTRPIGSYILPESQPGKKVVIDDTKKLATITKAPSSAVTLTYYVDEGEVPPDFYMLKAAGGLYIKAPDDVAQTVELSRYSDENCENPVWEYSTYLDYNQAINDINAIADPKSYYRIMLVNDIDDTMVTDASARGAWIWPGANKAAGLWVCGAFTEEDIAAGKVSRPFTFNGGAVNAYGTVKLTGLEFNCVDSKKGTPSTVTFNLKPNTDKNLSAEYKKSSLEIPSIVARDGSISVNGTKNVSNLILYPYKIQLASVQNTSAVLVNTELQITGKAIIDNLNLNNSSVDFKGATTIGNMDVEFGLNEEKDIAFVSYLSAKGVPNVTITGDVIGDVAYVELRDAGSTEPKNPEKCSNQPIVIAQKAQANMFMTKQLADMPDIVSLKDASKYVRCADIKDMAVKVIVGTYFDYNEADAINGTYARNYAEAITAINNMGNPSEEYTILLLDKSEFGLDDDSWKTIKTGTNNAYAAMTFPGKGKSAYVTILGNTEDGDTPVSTIEYTGNMTLTSNVIFKNVKLVEGSLDKKKQYVGKEDITLNTGNYAVRFAENTITGASNDSNTILFSQISGSGSLVLANRDAEITGKLALTDLNLRGAATVTGKNEINIKNLVIASDGDEHPVVSADKKLTIGNISGEADSEVMLKYYMQAPKLRSKTAPNLSITGNIDDVAVVLDPYYIEAGSVYPVTNQMNSLYVNGLEDGDDPNYYQSYQEKNDFELSGKIGQGKALLSAPLAQLNSVSLNNTSADRTLVFKQAGNVYVLNQKEPYASKVVVKGYSDAEFTNLTFESTYADFNNAMTELNKISSNKPGQPNSYVEVILTNASGVKGYVTSWLDEVDYSEPIMVSYKTVNMPTKVAKVRVVGGVLGFVGNTIDLKSDTEFIGTTIYGYNQKKETFNYGGYKYTVDVFTQKKFTINTGNFNLVVTDCPSVEDGNENTTFSVLGKAKGTGTFAYYPSEAVRDRYRDTLPTVNCILGDLRNLSSVSLYGGNPVEHSTYMEFGDDAGPDYTYVDYNCGEISSVTDFNVFNGESVVNPVPEGLIVNLNSKNFSVTNAYIPYAILKANNITVSQTTTVGQSALYAGTDYVGEGKLTLNDVDVVSNGNILSARQDAFGDSQIYIKGEIEGSVANPIEDSSIFNLLIYYNSKTEKTVKSKNLARLYDGMVLLKGDKIKENPYIEDEDGIPYTTVSPMYDTETTKYMGKGDGNSNVAVIQGVKQSDPRTVIYQRLN